MITCRSAAELERLARVNALVARVLAELAAMIAPGVTTAEVDALAERRLREAGADALLRCEMEAGHGGVSGRYSAWKQRAIELAWLLDVVGLAE